MALQDYMSTKRALATLLMAACSASSWAQVELPVAAGQLLSIGHGYAPGRSEPMTQCISGAIDVSGETRAVYGLDQPAIDGQLNEVLFPKLSLISFGGGSHTSPDDYVAGLLPARRTLRLAYTVKIGGRIAKLTKPVLNELGRKLKQSSSPQERRATCGDLYVRQVELGGYFVLTVTLSFLSNLDQKLVLDSAVFQHTALDELADELADLGERYRDKLKVTLDISQVGGELAAFYQLVQSLDQQGWLSCAYPAIDRCAKGIKTIYDYATTPSGLYQQFSRPIGPNDLSSFAFRRAALAPLNSVSPGFTEALPDYARELLALDQLIRALVDKRATIAALSALSEQDDSRINPRSFEVVRTTINSNLAVLAKAIDQCRRLISHCSDTAAAARDQLAEEALATALFPKSFVDVCLAEDQAIDDRLILEAVADGRSLETRDDCYSLLATMQGRHKVRLGGLGIQDASLLYEFSQLEWLELAQNRFTELLVASYWPNLALLDLAHNQLQRLQLGPAMPLAKLYLEGNSLATIVASAVPDGLSYWALFDNPLIDVNKTKNTLKDKATHLVVTPLDLCALHGKNLLPLGFFDPETLAAQLASGQGPDYAVIAGTTRFKGWRPCAEIYTNYPRI